MMPPIVKSYLIAFKKYKWIGMASFIVVLAGATIVALKPQPPTNYIATGSLTYTNQSVSFSKTSSEIQQEGKELNEEFLLSEQILDTVSTRLKIDSKTISANINLDLPKKNKAGELETNIIVLQYTDESPSIAKNVLDELMKEMVLSSQNLNSGRLKEIIQKINLLLPQAKRELQIAEQKLEQYDRKERPAILFAENGSLINAITLSQVQQRQIQLTIAGTKAQIQSLQHKLGLTIDRAYVASALSADPIIANLRTQIYQTESQIALLQKDLRPEHPTMIQLRRQQQAAEELLKKRAAEVLGGNGVAAPFAGDISGIRTQSSLDPTRQALANQLVTLQTQQDTLQEQLKQQISQEALLRQQYSAIPNKQLERSRLDQVVTLKKAIYDQIEAKLTDAKAAEAETVSSLSLAKQTTVKPAIVKAKSAAVTLGIGGFVGVALGTVIIFLLGSMEGILRTEEDIRKIFIPRDVQILGELPFILTDNLNDQVLPVITLLNSDYLELYEAFRSNLRRINGKNLKVLMIASISHEEGKTVTAYNLGIASARAGKRTLIVEMDWRSPTRSTSLKVNPDPHALKEPLLYYSNLGECIRLVPEVENLYIIPSPGAMQHSATIVESSEIRKLMADVRERFDLVILDTSPLSFSNDPYLIQPYSDGIILVARPNYTKAALLGQIIDQLLEEGLELIGGAINGADIPVIIPTSEPAIPLEMPITSPVGGGVSATSAKLDELSMSVGKS